MPFLQLTSSHIVGSHLSRPMGESSKIVPTLIENLRLGCFVRQFHSLAFFRNVTSVEPQVGHFTIPSGHLTFIMNAKHTSASLKYRIACSSVVGASVFVSITQS